MGETRTSFTNSPLWCPGSVVCAPVVQWAFTDICRLWALAQEGSGMSLAVRGATCVASRQLDVDAPSSSPVCARLHRFLFVEDRTAVQEAGGSQGSAKRVTLPHPHKAVAPCPRRLGASGEEVQPGATLPEREHVALGRWVSSERPTAS